MFEISELKDKSLSELQEIAKTVGAKKFSQLKKLEKANSLSIPIISEDEFIALLS